MPEPRAADVLIAVHELAANAVRHGAGAGRARLWAGNGVVTCRVEDGGVPGRHGRAGPGAGGPAEGRAEPWSCLEGHGLWLVRQSADELAVITGPDGTRVTAVFAFPADGPLPDTRLLPAG